MPDLVLILTTVPAGDDDSRTDELARTLVEERLAACVNVHGPMTSTYRWKGKIERDAERQLVIKTTRDRVPALEARLHAIHPYELPEFIILGAEGGGAGYLAWVAAETRP